MPRPSPASDRPGIAPGRSDSPGAGERTPDSARGLLALRLAMGIVWGLNLIFIFDPANGFFSGFASTANGFAAQSIGGAALPGFVAAHPELFAALIAAVTIYLAVAFLLGVTVRWACGVGILFASLLLITQFGGTFAIPGGTDVGPMPLYIGIYVALLWGRADRLGPLWTRAPRPSWRGLSMSGRRPAALWITPAAGTGSAPVTQPSDRGEPRGRAPRPAAGERSA